MHFQFNDSVPVIIFSKIGKNESGKVISTPLKRSSHQRCSVKKDVLKNFAKFTENTCARVSFAPESLLQLMYTGEFSEKNHFSVVFNPFKKEAVIT